MSLKTFLKSKINKKNYFLILVEWCYIKLRKLLSFIFEPEPAKVSLNFSFTDLDKKITTSSYVSKKNHGLLHRYLKNYSGISLSYMEKLLDAAYQVWLFPNKPNSLEIELIKLTQLIPSSSLPTSRWLSLYDISFNCGLLNLIILLREKAIESAYVDLKIRPNNKFSIIVAFKAAVEQKKFLYANKLLENLKKLTLKSQIIQEYELFLLSQRGKCLSKETNKYFLAIIRKPETQFFKKLIENKTIAIVGPAPNNEFSGEEIDSYDIVIRNNYIGSEKLGDYIEFGKRTDISYYNNFNCFNINKEKNFSFFNDLKACAFKSFNYPFQLDFLERKFAHKMIRPRLFFNGYSLLGANIIYDILHYSPSKIKVFNTNLYLTENLYNEKLLNNSEALLGSKIENLSSEIFKTFPYHDLISHYNFLNNIFTSPNITCDRTLKNILEMDLDKFLKKVKEIYLTSKA